MTWASLQNLCKQKRSVSQHFFIELIDVLAFYLAKVTQVKMAFIFDLNTNLNENNKEMS